MRGRWVNVDEKLGISKMADVAEEVGVGKEAGVAKAGVGEEPGVWAGVAGVLRRTRLLLGG